MKHGLAAALAPLAGTAAGAGHDLEGVDQKLTLGRAEGRVGVDERVAARRHAGIGDRIGGVVGLAVVLVPGGEVELVPPCSTSRVSSQENGATKLWGGQRVWLLWQS